MRLPPVLKTQIDRAIQLDPFCPTQSEVAVRRENALSAIKKYKEAKRQFLQGSAQVAEIKKWIIDNNIEYEISEQKDIRG